MGGAKLSVGGRALGNVYNLKLSEKIVNPKLESNCIAILHIDIFIVLSISFEILLCQKA